VMIRGVANDIKSGGTWTIDWYDKISHLNLLGVKCLLDEGAFVEFSSEVENLLKTCTAKRFYPEPTKAMRYSVIMEFQHLAKVSKSEKIRDRCLKWLLDVAEKCELNGFASDTDIFEALLDALASTYSSVSPAQKEMIKASIEKMANAKSNKLKHRYSLWLGDVSLIEKLCSTLRSDKSARVDVLFDEVKREMAVCVSKEVDEVKEELKAHYRSPDFAELISTILKQRVI